MTHFRRAAVILFLGVAAAAMPASARAEAPTINHDAVGCIVVDKFPRLEARFDPAENVSRGRLRFRPTGGAHWYSVPMKQEVEAFVGVMPKPTPKLKSLDYYVEVTATDFATGRTAEYKPDVVAGLGACQGDKITAGSLGSASIILEVPAGAPAVPAGFSSVGIVSATAAAAGAVAAGAAAAGAGGISTTALVVGGVVVAGGVVAAGAAASGGGSDSIPPPPPPTPCVPSLGQIDFSVVPAFSGEVACSSVNGAQQTYRVTNNSACLLQLDRLQAATTFACAGGTATGTTTFEIPLEVRSVAANSSVVVHTGAPARSVGPGGYCCEVQPCLCVDNHTDTITLITNAGAKAAQYTFTVNPRLSPCPTCPGPANNYW